MAGRKIKISNGPQAARIGELFLAHWSAPFERGELGLLLKRFAENGLPVDSHRYLEEVPDRPAHIMEPILRESAGPGPYLALELNGVHWVMPHTSQFKRQHELTLFPGFLAATQYVYALPAEVKPLPQEIRKRAFYIVVSGGQLTPHPAHIYREPDTIDLEPGKPPNIPATLPYLPAPPVNPLPAAPDMEKAKVAPRMKLESDEIYHKAREEERVRRRREKHEQDEKEAAPKSPAPRPSCLEHIVRFFVSLILLIVLGAVAILGLVYFHNYYSTRNQGSSEDSPSIPEGEAAPWDPGAPEASAVEAAPMAVPVNPSGLTPDPDQAERVRLFMSYFIEDLGGDPSKRERRIAYFAKEFYRENANQAPGRGSTITRRQHMEDEAAYHDDFEWESYSIQEPVTVLDISAAGVTKFRVSLNVRWSVGISGKSKQGLTKEIYELEYPYGMYEYPTITSFVSKRATP